MTEENFRELVKSDDPILNNPVPYFDFAEHSKNEIKEISEILAFNVIKRQLLGLSANQLNIPVRAFCVASNPMLVFFNPVIVDYSTKTNVLEEASPLFPGFIIKIKRPVSIRLRFTYPNGETKTTKYAGMTSRVIQHQLHFLDGEKFYSLASKYHYDQAMKKWRKFKKNDED